MTAATTTAEPAPPAELPRQPWNRHLAVVAVLAVLLVPLPLVLPGAQEAVLVRVMIFAILSIGWNVMSGFGGMFSFGHAAYFALATFAFAEMLRLWATNSDLVNRAEGYHVPLLPESSWWYLQFEPGSPNYFWIALALTVAALVVSILFLRSRAGQFTLAARDDEEAAASIGIPVMRYKLMTMALAGAISSVAGAFYVQYYLFIDPDLAFGSSQSIQAILPAVIGGVATIWGPVIGAAVLGPLSDVTATVLRNPPPFLEFLQGRGGLDVILYGLLLIVIILLLPKGIYGALRDRWSRR